MGINGVCCAVFGVFWLFGAIKGQPITIFDVFVDNSAKNDSSLCSSSNPCKTLDYAIELLDTYLGSHVNQFSIELTGNGQYDWGESWTTYSDGASTTSTFDIFVKSESGETTSTVIDWNDIAASTPAISSSDNENVDITISNITLTNNLTEYNMTSAYNGQNYFWQSSNNDGYNTLTFENCIIKNLSRSVDFCYNSNSVWYTGSGVVNLKNVLIKDVKMGSGQFWESTYGGGLNMKNVVWDNYYATARIESRSNARYGDRWENVKMINCYVSDYTFYLYGTSKSSGLDLYLNNIDISNHYSSNTFLYHYSNNNNGENSSVSIRNVNVENSYIGSGFYYLYRIYEGSVYIDNVTFDESEIGSQGFYVGTTYYWNYNSSIAGGYSYHIYGESCIMTHIDIVDSIIWREMLFPYNFEYTEIGYINLYNSDGFNYSRYHEDLILDDDGSVEGIHYWHDIRVWNILMDYCIVCSYGAKVVNMTNIWADNVHADGWVFFDLEYWSRYDELTIVSSNIYVNGHYLDYDYASKYDYFNDMYNEAIMYFYYEMDYDSGFGLWNGYESESELCSHFVNYHYNWTLIDNALWGPVFILQYYTYDFGCNTTFDALYVANTTCMYGNWWYSWVSYSNGFEPPPGIIYYYGYEPNHYTIYIENSVFEYNNNYTLAQCDPWRYCTIVFKNCIFNYNYLEVERTDPLTNQTYLAKLYNAVWLADESQGSVKIYDSIFIGDYENQIGGINASWLYNASANSTFECIRCTFRQDYFTDAPTVEPTQPTMGPTDDTPAPTVTQFYDWQLSISLFGNFEDEIQDFYGTKVVSDAVESILNDISDESYNFIDVWSISLSENKLLFGCCVNYTSIESDELISILENDLIDSIDNEDTTDVFASDISSVVVELGISIFVTTSQGQNGESSNTGNDSGTDTSTQVALIGMAIGMAVMFVIIVILSIFFIRSRNQSGKNNGSDKNPMNNNNNDNNKGNEMDSGIAMQQMHAISSVSTIPTTPKSDDEIRLANRNLSLELAEMAQSAITQGSGNDNLNHVRNGSIGPGLPKESAATDHLNEEGGEMQTIYIKGPDGRYTAAFVPMNSIVAPQGQSRPQPPPPPLLPPKVGQVGPVVTVNQPNDHDNEYSENSQDADEGLFGVTQPSPGQY